ncbi:MAG: hypothetical protein VB089_02805, partial [Anaerolineaceae bacterium]|nr:hypothetical protein [Anaerolineaceae bacterium]
MPETVRNSRRLLLAMFGRAWKPDLLLEEGHTARLAPEANFHVPARITGTCPRRRGIAGVVSFPP